MKIVVLGSAGQLGRDLCPRLPGTVAALTRADVDLGDTDRLTEVIGGHAPDVVVNCAAYNFVDKAESEPAAAFAVNAFAVRELARVCHQLSAKLIHVGTDYVFGLDEARDEPFRETDPPGPVSVYGASKLAGEHFVRSASTRNLVVRTCGLYGVWGAGGKGSNFVETMLRVAGQGKPLRVVGDQRCTPSYTADVAAWIAALIEQNATGLFHVTNAGHCSWYELAAAAFEIAGISADLSRIPSSGYPTPARRPAYSVLSNESLVEAGVPRPRPWHEALAAYLAERNTRST